MLIYDLYKIYIYKVNKSKIIEISAATGLCEMTS